MRRMVSNARRRARLCNGLAVADLACPAYGGWNGASRQYERACWPTPQQGRFYAIFWMLRSAAAETLFLPAVGPLEDKTAALNKQGTQVSIAAPTDAAEDRAIIGRRFVSARDRAKRQSRGLPLQCRTVADRRHHRACRHRPDTRNAHKTLQCSSCFASSSTSLVTSAMR